MYFRDAPWFDEELSILADGVGKFLDAELIPREEEFARAGMSAGIFGASRAKTVC